MGANGTKGRSKLKYEGLSIETLSGTCVVESYENSYNITVKFEDGTFVNTTAKQLQTRRIKNPNKPAVYGVGFVGQGNYANKTDPAVYKFWNRMLERCYSDKYREKKPTYTKCETDNTWHNFQNFAEWFYNQKYEAGWELDKDLLVKGNKTYGPTYCCFVPRELNLLISHNKRGDKSNPIGVFFSNERNMFCSQCTDRYGNQVVLGFSEDKEYLLGLYREFKGGIIRQAANEWRGRIDDKLYESLINWEV